MADRIGDYFPLNALPRPDGYGWMLEEISREAVDGSAYRRSARRARPVPMSCMFLAPNAATAHDLADALVEDFVSRTDVVMVVDDRIFPGVIILEVSGPDGPSPKILPIGTHSAGWYYDGSLAAGVTGSGARLVLARIVVGRSGQP